MEVPGRVRLDGVQPSHLHLQQPVLPVEAGHTEIVNASGDVAEGLAILEEAVMVVVDLECSLGGVVQTKCRAQQQRHQQQGEEANDPGTSTLGPLGSAVSPGSRSASLDRGPGAWPRAP